MQSFALDIRSMLVRSAIEVTMAVLRGGLLEGNASPPVLLIAHPTLVFFVRPPRFHHLQTCIPLKYENFAP